MCRTPKPEQKISALCCDPETIIHLGVGVREHHSENVAGNLSTPTRALVGVPFFDVKCLRHLTHTPDLGDVTWFGWLLSSAGVEV